MSRYKINIMEHQYYINTYRYPAWVKMLQERLNGQIDEIQEQTFGSLAVYASGEAAKIDAAVEHLRASGVQVQIVSSKD